MAHFQLAEGAPEPNCVHGVVYALRPPGYLGSDDPRPFGDVIALQPDPDQTTLVISSSMIVDMQAFPVWAVSCYNLPPKLTRLSSLELSGFSPKALSALAFF
jgi:hypothetical protein